MVDQSWYRNTTWNRQIRDVFESRLSKCRSDYNKAQYLRIQGYTLQSSEDPTIRKIGRELFLRVINDYPEQDSQVPDALIGLGESFESDHDYENAEKYYRQSIAYVKGHCEKSGEIFQSYLLLPELIIKTKQQGKYIEALDMLTHWKGLKYIPFHDEQYRYCLAIARLSFRLSMKKEAALFANKALELSDIGKLPQFSRHPNIGIVKTTQEEIRELNMITVSSQSP